MEKIDSSSQPTAFDCCLSDASMRMTGSMLQGRCVCRPAAASLSKVVFGFSQVQRTFSEHLDLRAWLFFILLIHLHLGCLRWVGGGVVVWVGGFGLGCGVQGWGVTGGMLDKFSILKESNIEV